MIFKALGRGEEAKYIYIPLWFLNTINRRSERVANIAETARLVRYYSTQDMHTTDPSEIFGNRTLQDHFNRVAVEGEVYDPNTQMMSAMLESAKTEEEKKL